MIDIAADPALVAVLRSFGAGPDDLLGWGGEAVVVALDADRIVRVLHRGGDRESLERRYELVEELRAGSNRYALPELLEITEVAGRTCAVERRIPGTSVLRALDHVGGPDRDRLVEAHLQAAADLSDLPLTPRGWYGDLLAGQPVRTATWKTFLVTRAAQSLASAPAAFSEIDPEALADELPDTDAQAFVHLDAFTGNMMTTGTTITAVIDIGPTSAVGDRHLDALAAVVYLGAPQITASATKRDLDVASSWLRSHDLLDRLEPTRRWLAAYWAWAVDDAKLQDWCRTVLGPR